MFGCHYRGLPESRQPVEHLIGASMSVRTAALRAVGGFHSDDHDDMDLSHRIAAGFGPSAVVYEPRARISHFVPAVRVSWRYFWRRCYTINRSKVRAFADCRRPATSGLSCASRASWSVPWPACCCVPCEETGMHCPRPVPSSRD